MDHNPETTPTETVTPVKKKGGRPKGSKNTKLKKKLEPNPEHVALVKSGKSQSEVEVPEVEEAEPSSQPGIPWVHTHKAAELRKKYPRAWKWPDQKFWHCLVTPGDMINFTIDEGDVRAIPITIDRGVGVPVNILLNKPVVLPNEIVEALKDMTIKYPKVKPVPGNPAFAFENANGFNDYEWRSRYKVMVAGPATPEDYEAGTADGKNRR